MVLLVNRCTLKDTLPEPLFAFIHEKERVGQSLHLNYMADLGQRLPHAIKSDCIHGRLCVYATGCQHSKSYEI